MKVVVSDMSVGSDSVDPCQGHVFPVNRPTRQCARHYTPRRVNRTSATRKSGPFGDWTGIFGSAVVWRKAGDCCRGWARILPRRRAQPHRLSTRLSLSLREYSSLPPPSALFAHSTAALSRAATRRKRQTELHTGAPVVFLSLLFPHTLSICLSRAPFSIETRLQGPCHLKKKRVQKRIKIGK